jgi:3-methyladenine DNA glycosylase AlkD
MGMSEAAGKIYLQIANESTKLGDIRKIAKEIKKDHNLAIELWGTGDFYCRQLAILIIDKKLLDEELIGSLCTDIESHSYDEMNQLTDWLMANQLMKSKKTIALIESWENSESSVMRRIFWYYQGRLRWTGKTPPNDSGVLVNTIKDKIMSEKPEVQWAMNFTAAQIGIHQEEYREECIDMGEKFGLYKDEPYSKGCTPAYLPKWINIEVDKLASKK